MKYLLIFLSAVFFSPALRADTIELRAGMIIRNSVTVVANTYHLNAAAGIAAITIEGNDIVVDLNRCVIVGSNDKELPNEYNGFAIRIKKGAKNITIRNGSIHGYKIAIIAEQVNGLTINDCDLSYNYRQQLYSTREKEDPADWLQLQTNEQEEWQRYGAGIYVNNCRKAVIKNNIVTGGQCALMMTGCEQSEIYDNNFSFNAGLGVGLYRSSGNKIYHNRLDYIVRGYSQGKYRTAQNSAGLLLCMQSNDNIVAYNSITHCGNGIMLLPGQTALTTGKGSNRENFLYGNDMSYSLIRGIEMIFSQGLAMKNIIADCEQGIWGEYIFDSDITDNQFANNHVGLAIEQGQNINIALNTFSGDSIGIQLTSHTQSVDTYYAALKTSRSRNYWIAANRFTSNRIGYSISETDTVVFSGNTKINVAQGFQLGTNAQNIDSSLEEEPLEMDYQKDPKLAQLHQTELVNSSVPKGKENIRVTEWGPYNFQYPLLWLKDIDSSGIYHFEVLGPRGNWEIAVSEGFDILSKSGPALPAQILAKPDTQKTGRVLQLKYTGEKFVDNFGKPVDAVVNPYLFEYREYPMNKE